MIKNINIPDNYNIDQHFNMFICNNTLIKISELIKFGHFQNLLVHLREVYPC